MRILFFNPEQYLSWKNEPSNYELRLPILNCGLVTAYRDYVYQKVLRSQGRDAMNERAIKEVLEFKPDLVVHSTSWPQDSIAPYVFQKIMELGIPVYTHIWDTHIEHLPHELEWYDNCTYFGVADSITNYLYYKSQAENHPRVKGVIFTSGNNVLTDLVYPQNVQKKYDVTIIGSYQGQRINLIKYLKYKLSSKDINVYKFGGLIDSTKLDVTKGETHQGVTDAWVSWEKYVDIINQSQICLSSQTRPNRNQIKGKVFDYLACKTLCFSDFNTELRRVVPEDCIVYYTDFDDCVNKIIYYCSNEKERIALAERGYQWFKETFNYKQFWSQFLKAAINKNVPLPDAKLLSLDGKPENSSTDRILANIPSSLPKDRQIKFEFIEDFNSYNIFSWNQDYLGLPQALGAVNFNEDDVENMQGVFVEPSIDQLKGRIVAEAPPYYQNPQPKLIEEFQSYNIFGLWGDYIGIPQAAGAVDLELDNLRKIDGVIIERSQDRVKQRILKLRHPQSNVESDRVRSPHSQTENISDLFAKGNYSELAINGSSDRWETYAAMGLMGKIPEAIAGLSKFDCPEARFYSGVASWMDGDEVTAIRTLEKVSLPHAQNLLDLIRKPKISILAQLPWNRSAVWDLLSASTQDQKFEINNFSFHPEDTQNEPYADVHRYYEPHNPPDFYICQMVEWHQIPPNIQELSCPILGHTADYDLHIQAIMPWLQIFDELIVLDSSEWEDVHPLVQVPVSTYPKSFGVSASLPPVPTELRDIDVFQSGTVLHPYHLDKAPQLHQILGILDGNIQVFNTFLDVPTYRRLLGKSKTCYTYVRHPGAMPTRALDALCMGCAVVVQEGCTLTLYVGEREGVLTYDAKANNLGDRIREIINNWSEFEDRARKGAEIIRREFQLSRVASQYLRFLTFLAAKPRGKRQLQPTEQLIQKRYIMFRGWLPTPSAAYEGNTPILKKLGEFTLSRFQDLLQTGNVSSHLTINLVREIILYHAMNADRSNAAIWVNQSLNLYAKGLAEFPNSLVLRFNLIRVALHFGQPSAVSEALRLAQETLNTSQSYWQIDALEDVFPWDFAETLFNYRTYFDLATKHLKKEAPLEREMVRLILASLNYYWGYFSENLEYFKEAATLDPEFPFYKLDYAKRLAERGNPRDYPEAGALLTELAGNSILFLEAFKLLQQLQEKQLFVDINWPRLERIFNLFQDRLVLTTEPKFIESLGVYNLLVWKANYYGLPQALGPVNFDSGVDNLPGVVIESSIQKLREKVAALSPPEVVHPEPEFIEEFGSYNIFTWRGKYLGVPQVLGAVDLNSNDLAEMPGMAIAPSLDAVKKLMAEPKLQSNQASNQSTTPLTDLERSFSQRQDEGSLHNLSELFAAGNYAAVAMNGSPNCWETYAAMGLMGKIPEAIAGLNKFNHPEARFYSAVASWINGDETTAIGILETISTPHAQNLLALIRKPQIQILAQLPWNRSSAWDLLTASAKDRKFQVRNLSFHHEDLPNEPYANIHQFYNSEHPPDFYICQMVEWHLIPPNIQELPCPILGHTADYDLQIQAVYPWLQIFDELIVLDSSEWEDVRGLVGVPVSTFPKSFGVSPALPAVPVARRKIDVFQSGTVLHPYHLDKVPLVHQILGMSDVKVEVFNKFLDLSVYRNLLGESKSCYTYVRHPGAMPTRALDALSMGCAVVVQKESALTMYVGEAEGVLTYDGESNDLPDKLREIVNNWPEFEMRARKGAEIIRREFELSRVASQYLRFLTFLAAKPRGQRQKQLAENLIQKRYVLEKGWLPGYGVSPILRRMNELTVAKLQTSLQIGEVSSRLSIDVAREIVLYNWGFSARKSTPILIEDLSLYNIIGWRGNYYCLPKALGPVDFSVDKVEKLPGVLVEKSLPRLKERIGIKSLKFGSVSWVEDSLNFYCQGLVSFPKSLVLRFNLIRVALHFGRPQEVSTGLQIAEETLNMREDYWEVDVLEDVFPWDFGNAFFNYRRYFDLVTENLSRGVSVETELVKLILASIHYYLGRYQDGDRHFQRATVLDSEFPFYKLEYAKKLLTRGQVAEAGALLTELSDNSLVFAEALQLLQELVEKGLYFTPRWQELKGKLDRVGDRQLLEEGLEQLPLSPSVETSITKSSVQNIALSSQTVPKIPRSKLLSVVVTGRNDDYMGNFKYRLTTCLNYLCRNLQHLGRLDDVEILITDWNSDVPLANVLTLSPEASRICKFVCVPPEIATRLQAPGEVFYPTCAMNSSLRRAKGEFVMMFDADSLMPYHSLRSLLDVLEGKQPVGLKLDQTFFYSSRHHLPLEVVQQELSLEELDRYLLLNGPGFSKDEGWPGLGVCGAAQMMHRSLWQECRGYNQDFRIQGWLDAELTLRVTQHYAWVDLLSLGVVLFHMEHWADNRQGKENAQKHNPHDVSSSLAVNDENWGLGNYELEIKRI